MLVVIGTDCIDSCKSNLTLRSRPCWSHLLAKKIYKHYFLYFSLLNYYFLSGITINTLWKRLDLRPGFVINLDDKSKLFLWRRLLTVTDLQYYELPKPRPQVDIWNRMDFVDPDSGHMVELNKVF
jgi:hypothetical protein